MKRALFLSIILLAAGLNAQSPVSSTSSTEMALRGIIMQWQNGYNSGNAALVAALYANDAYYLTQHYITGIVQGRPAIQAYVQRGVDAHYQIDSIKIISMDYSDDFAYVITRYDANNGGQKAFGVNVVVLKKTAAKWLIVAHEAAVPDPATAVQSLSIPAHP